jgi:cell division protein FtsW (lipid II flippase)
MGLIYPFVALPIFALFIVGLVLLYRRKLSVSVSKELSGSPAIILSLSYLIISIIAFVKIFYYTGDVVIDYIFFGFCIFVVTIVSMFYVKSKSGIM